VLFAPYRSKSHLQEAAKQLQSETKISKEIATLAEAFTRLQGTKKLAKAVSQVRAGERDRLCFQIGVLVFPCTVLSAAARQQAAEFQPQPPAPDSNPQPTDSNPQELADSLKGLEETMALALRKAQKDNDNVYLERVRTGAALGAHWGRTGGLGLSFVHVCCFRAAGVVSLEP